MLINRQTEVPLQLHLLVHAGLPLKFWARAILTTAYLLNQLPTCSASDNNLLSVTLHELMHGTPPSIDHLRVFGSICYPVTPHLLQHGGTVMCCLSLIL